MTQSAKQQRFGKCLLERVIGSGARSTVYLAWHEGLQIPVAVKVMKRVTGPQEAQTTERFVREARIAAQLSHPHIVRVYDCGERGDSCYLVLEYIEGENCRDKLDQWGAFDWQRAVQIVRQVAEGLAYASRKGIIHRDLKPENIMIDNEGNARIADLGLAKEIVTHGSSATQDGDVLGTPYYMSPEQIRQPSDVDFRADLYSLGATLHHMVVGEPPFDAATPFEIMAKHLNEPLASPQAKRPELPPALCDIIVRCMAKDPKDRYPNYAELIRDLDRVEADAPEAIPAPAVLPPPAPGPVAGTASTVRIAAPAAPVRILRPVELPATRSQFRAKLMAIAALVGYGLLIVFLYQYLAMSAGLIAATAGVVAMLLLPAGCAYLAMRQQPGPEQPQAGDGADGLQGVVAELCQRVGLAVPRLHVCRRRDDAAFAYGLFSHGAILHVPGLWLKEAEPSEADTQAFLAQSLAGFYTGDSLLRTLLAAPVSALHLGRSLGGRLADTLAEPGRPLHRVVAQGLTLAWIVGACAVIAVLFFHAFWAGVLGLGVLTELLLTASFERYSRHGADSFAAKVVGLEAVQSLLVLRALRGPDARRMLEQCMGPELTRAWSGHPLVPQERPPVVQSAVAYYGEMEYSPDTLELARNIFSLTPSPAERLNRLAGLTGGHSVLDALVSTATRLYARLLGQHSRDRLNMQDLFPGKLSVLAGALAGALVVAVTGLLYMRGGASYTSLVAVVSLLALALGFATTPVACREQLSANRLGWALTTSAVALTLVAMVGLCLLGSPALTRFAVQFPAGLVLTLLLSAGAAALFVRLGPLLGAGFNDVAAPPAASTAPLADGEAEEEADPAEDMLTPELAEAQSAAVSAD